MARLSLMLPFVAAVLAGCATVLPSDGPTSGAFTSEQKQTEYELVKINPASLSGMRVDFIDRFVRRLGGNTPPSSHALSPGDELTVIIWEQGGSKIYAEDIDGGTRQFTKFEGLRIDPSGRIFLPYLGNIRVAGLSVGQARKLLERRASRSSLKPQVQLLLTNSQGSRFTITGAVKKPGNFDLVTMPGATLLKVLAKAGGVKETSRSAFVITVTRNGRRASVRLSELYKRPENDIYVHPGDKIVVTYDPLVFTLLGAVRQAGKYEFDSDEVSLIDALAKGGGLDDMRANATGVFVLRFEYPSVLNSIWRSQGYETRQYQSDLVPTVYVLNLSDPSAIFYAKQFAMRDGDTVFVTNAPAHQWNKVIGMASSTLFLGTSAYTTYSILNP